MEMFTSKLVLQGANASQLEKEIGSDQFPANEHYFGLVNVSNQFLLLQLSFPLDKIYMYIVY